MPSIAIPKQQRKLAGNAMHSGIKAIQSGALFTQSETNYREARDRRDAHAEEREAGNVVMTLLIILGIIGLSVGSYYVGKNLWGELLVTYDFLGQRSFLVAGVISVVLTVTFVLANMALHANGQRGFNEAGFTPNNTNRTELGIIILYVVLRLGIGVVAWWLLQVSLSAITPNFKITYNELTYVFADLLLIVGEWMLSRWMGRHGIVNIQFALAGLATRFAERSMNRSAEQCYERYFEQRRYITLHNDAGFEPPLEEQGSPNVQRAINYHMGMNQEVENQPPPVQPAGEQPAQRQAPAAAEQVVVDAQEVAAQPAAAPQPHTANEVNLDNELNDIAEQVGEQEEPAMTLDDYINEQTQSRTNNLFD